MLILLLLKKCSSFGMFSAKIIISLTLSADSSLQRRTDVTGEGRVTKEGNCPPREKIMGTMSPPMCRTICFKGLNIFKIKIIISTYLLILCAKIE